MSQHFILADPPFIPRLFRMSTKDVLLWLLINTVSLTNNPARLFVLQLKRVKGLVTKQIYHLLESNISLKKSADIVPGGHDSAVCCWS